MSVLSKKIETAKNDVSTAYQLIIAKGGTFTGTLITANLAEAIDSIKVPTLCTSTATLELEPGSTVSKDYVAESNTGFSKFTVSATAAAPTADAAVIEETWTSNDTHTIKMTPTAGTYFNSVTGTITVKVPTYLYYINDILMIGGNNDEFINILVDYANLASIPDIMVFHNWFMYLALITYDYNNKQTMLINGEHLYNIISKWSQDVNMISADIIKCIQDFCPTYKLGTVSDDYVYSFNIQFLSNDTTYYGMQIPFADGTVYNIGNEIACQYEISKTQLFADAFIDEFIQFLSFAQSTTKPTCATIPGAFTILNK